MNHHASNPAANNEESSLMSSTMFTAKSALDDERSEVSSIQQFFIAEERREQVTESTKLSNVRAMKQKFEQASKSKGESQRRPFVCGSPVAERKRQLQQVLFLAKDEASESSQIVTNSKDNTCTQEQKQTLKNGRGKTLVKKNKNTSRVVADRKKMFEKTSLATDIRSSGAATEGSHTEVNQDATLTMTVSDSEFSTLDYTGSLFSEDTQAGRDEVEAARPPVTPEKRETLDSQPLPNQELEYTAEPHPSNSFGDVFQSVGDEDFGCSAPAHTDDLFQDSVSDGEQHALAYTTSLSPNNSFQEALHEIVQSFQDDASAQQSPFGHISPHDSVKGNEEVRESTKHSTVFVMDSGRADDPSPVSMLTSFDTDTDPPCHVSSTSRGSGEGEANPHGHRKSTKPDGLCAPLVVKTARDHSSTDVLPNSLRFSTVEQEEERERTKNETQDRYGPYDELNPSAGKQHVNTEPEVDHQSKSGPIRTAKGNAEFSKAQKEEAQTDPVRYELADQSAQPIKGILKNKVVNKNVEATAPLSPVSSASWYSSASSMATSDISQQLSPIQKTQNNRFSIGGYVNAHLSGNPFKSSAEKSSEKEKRSKWSHRLERKDSASSSVASRARNQAASPSSMDAQHSQSNHHQDRQDFHEIANNMTTMANTASTAVLDVLVDAADKVVVSPLLSLFSCVDESETLLCSGMSAAEDFLGVPKKRHRNKRLRHRSRKFQA